MKTATKATHTPGPWHLSPNFGYVRKNTGHIDDGPKDFNIASIHDFGEEAEVRANARLIAAAPEMLEALEALLDTVPYASTPSENKIHRQAEAAIRKARGE